MIVQNSFEQFPERDIIKSCITYKCIRRKCFYGLIENWIVSMMMTFRFAVYHPRSEYHRAGKIVTVMKHDHSNLNKEIFFIHT